jgi:hypothetical protein
LLQYSFREQIKQVYIAKNVKDVNEIMAKMPVDAQKLNKKLSGTYDADYKKNG